MKNLDFKHGGNIFYFAEKFNFSLSDIIDASASIIPFSIPDFLKKELCLSIKNESFTMKLNKKKDSFTQQLQKILVKLKI